ncbi:AsnC family protein [Gandjariella thermophila]|uniref:AsnC family protein n=1 Tax=Gandjariella thermophila TaxID=1931992 RepID=UPI0010F983E0|nr:AsnC family protein [Gandjariella thermophila]
MSAPDPVDARLLAVLAELGRAAVHDIAARMGMDPREVAVRLVSLSATGLPLLVGAECDPNGIRAALAAVGWGGHPAHPGYGPNPYAAPSGAFPVPATPHNPYPVAQSGPYPVPGVAQPVPQGHPMPAPPVAGQAPGGPHPGSGPLPAPAPNAPTSDPFPAPTPNAPTSGPIPAPAQAGSGGGPAANPAPTSGPLPAAAPGAAPASSTVGGGGVQATTPTGPDSGGQPVIEAQPSEVDAMSVWGPPQTSSWARGDRQPNGAVAAGDSPARPNQGEKAAAPAESGATSDPGQPSTPGQIPRRTGTVGETLETEGLAGERLSIRLVEVVDPADVLFTAAGYRLQDGERAVVVHTELTNRGRVPFTTLPDLYLVLITTDGRTVAKAPVTLSSRPPHRIGVQPGETTGGHTVYVVPEAANTIAVRWSPRPDDQAHSLTWTVVE